MDYNHRCPMELHLHELQGSVRIISRGCDAHNHRFAAVSCEPVTLGNGSHAHQVTFRTDSCEGHYHEFSGRTEGAVRVGEGHVHYLEGITSERNGHRHCFKVITNIEDPIGD